MKQLRRIHCLRNEKGISLAEFALILPVFLAILLGIVDLGQGFNTYLGMLNATREGVIWLANNPDDLAGMNARISTELARVKLTLEHVNSTRVPEQASYDSGDIITLRLEYSYDLLFGALTGLPSLTLRTENTMVVPPSVIP
ncbi:MAG: pilus assembly protein [Caldilineaceae bacterium]